MALRVNCIICDKTEDLCKCDKYCALCHDDDQIRLCQDGQYYCLNCREACDYQVTD
jgi:sulfur transfer complex TusBCD TusB component (DsrH family)